MKENKNKAIILFLYRFCLFLVPVIALHLWAAYKADGLIDYYYGRLISPKQNSLVVGTSRAEQDIVPSIFNAETKKNGIQTSLYNYAFNLGVTPFGKAYFNSIKNKLDTSKHTGLFLVCVDPWAIAIEKTNTDNDAGQEENTASSPIAVSNVNTYPNFEYLFKHYNNGWGNILLNEYSNHTPEIIHNDGWLEVTLDMDSALNAQRTSNRVGIYRNDYVKKYHFSNSRFSYLVSTIQYLKHYGTVILVRLPVSKDIYQIEENYMPGFSDKMDSLSKNLSVPYLSYANTGDQYLFTDGNHMYKGSSKKFTVFLANDILKQDLLPQ